MADADPIIHLPALMIYDKQDVITVFAGLLEFVPNVEVASTDLGHWIQQKKPDETNQVILNWLKQQNG